MGMASAKLAELHPSSEEEEEEDSPRAKSDSDEDWVYLCLYGPQAE